MKLPSLTHSLRLLKLLPAAVLTLASSAPAQTIQTRLPAMEAPHEGTWLQWPHHYTYGTSYRSRLDATWVAMTRALVPGERVHIIAYNATEQARINTLLTNAGVPLARVDYLIRQTDDTWVRDNGPIFVFDQSGALRITDWGFDGWGDDTPYAKDDSVPTSVAAARSLSRTDISNTVLEGGAIEVDGQGVLMSTRSAILDAKRNPGLTQAQLEARLTTHFGVRKFIWLDGAFGGADDITDMHIDGFAVFAPERTLVTMSRADLAYWGLSTGDINTLYAATDVAGVAYRRVTLPLTKNDVVTTYGESVGFKGSYANFYVGNTTVLVPVYSDPNDAAALSLIQSCYPGRTVTGIDCRNLYINGGMVHCVTQQQPDVPMALTASGGTPGGLTLSFTGNAGTTYRLQSSSTLRADSWRDVETFTHSGNSRLFPISTSGAARQFYRAVAP